MSGGPRNIVLGGMGVCVKRTDEEIKRSMILVIILKVSQGLLASIVPTSTILKVAKLLSYFIMGVLNSII